MKPDATCETVDAISGCVMLIPRQIFEAIGPFDESYFFSFEDLDFCSRARAAGFGVVVDTRAAAYHEGGRSVHASPNDRLYFAARNHLRLAASTAPDASRVAHLSRLSAIVLLNLAHAGTAKGGSLASRVIAVLRGTKDYAAGRFGPGRSSLKPVREPAARATPRSLR
jgi:GT2 family glycosyltransferase